jgi:hypothetical protein
MYGIIVFYSGLDAWQTWMLLESGLAYKVNPLISYLIDVWGYWPAVCVVKGVALSFFAWALILYQRRD